MLSFEELSSDDHAYNLFNERVVYAIPSILWQTCLNLANGTWISANN